MSTLADPVKAAYYEAFRQPIEIRSVPDPSPGPDGVVIRVEASGLCRSDWHGWQGHDPDIVLPHVPGHEFAGVVVATGSAVEKWVPGLRVTVPFVGGCGQCAYCAEGSPQVCENQFQPGFTAWGSFAEFVAVEYADQNLVALPETVDFETAAALGCRFITAYWALTNQGRLRAGEKLAVFGCGGLGLAAVQIGAAIGAEVYAVDVRESSCAQALELGAVAAINASHTDAVSTILDLSGGGVHLSVDALGSMETCLNAISCLRRKGRHVQAGLLTGSDADISLPLPRLIGEELEIIGSHGMPAWNYKPMFNFLEKHELDPGKLVTRHIGLNQLPQALENLDSSDQSGIVVVNSFR